jgi:shikimate kinase
LFLVGYMGAGKTSVGRILAQRLGWTFCDLDERIEAQQNCTIAEVFRRFGEKEFRDLEAVELARLIQELRTSNGAVVALGGGTILRDENQAQITNQPGVLIFLDAPIEELWSRAKSGGRERPLAGTKNQFQQLYESRRQRYMEADLQVSTSGKRVDEVAEQIAAELELDTHSRGEGK